MHRLQCLKLVSRGERWGLTWSGWLLIGLLAISLCATCFLGIHPFLAVSSPSSARYLVVEGWVKTYAIKAAVQEFQAGHYERIYTTGGPVSGLGFYLNDYSTSASVGAGRLKDSGIAADRVQMVPSRWMARDRTYSSAIALREFFAKEKLQVSAINIVTEGLHARRTRLLFQKALGPEVEVGIIAVPPVDYDAAHWWRYSEGVREVLGETIAYIYARVFFHP